MSSVVHFYHVYAAGEWRDPVAEHLHALHASGYDGPFHVGLVGTPEQRAEVLDELHWIRQPTAAYQADTGWEQVTLDPLYQHALNHDGEILYAHTKGAWDPSSINIEWRRSMTWQLVHGWQAAAQALADTGSDAVGCHWLSREVWGDMPGVPLPCFGGNFWLAASRYIRTLAAPANTCRHDAEAWIGTGDYPQMLDLTPGWPGSAAFPPYRHAQLIAGR